MQDMLSRFRPERMSDGRRRRAHSSRRFDLHDA